MPRTFNSLDEFRAIAGEDIGTSQWYTITQQQIDTFAEATGDHQWIHVDPERAAQGPFGTTIAHGYLTLSLIPVLSEDIYTLEGRAMGVNYGANKVRFPAPVPVDSRVRGTATLLDVTDVDMGAQFTIKFVIEIEGSDKPACIAEVITIVSGS